jgi:hypothetical protein
LFVPASRFFNLPPASVQFARDAAIRYTVSVPVTTGVKTAHLNDGNWTLASPSTVVAGETCDLLDTCFSAVPPGTYRLTHQWPQFLKAGFTLSIGSIVVAGLLLALCAARRHRRRLA